MSAVAPERIEVETLLEAGKGQSLAEVLQRLEELLRSGSPLIHQSLQQPASAGQLQRVAVAAGIEGPLPAELVTWWQWHNGQTPNPHRSLAPNETNYYLLSADESAALIEKSKQDNNYTEGWIPLIGLPEVSALWACGLHTSGLHTGALATLNHDQQPCFQGLKHLALNILAMFQDVFHRPPPEQYWVHGVAAILVEANGYHHALPGGLWPRAQAQSVTWVLFKHWSITSPEGLRKILLRLESGGDDSADLAFDLGRASALAGFGRAAGWLSVEESWGFQLRAARRIQAAYSSWQAFADGYANSLWSQMQIREDERTARLFADPTSPFQLPWDTVLSEIPTPDLPPLRVKLSPDQHDELNLLVTRHNTRRMLEIELEAGFYVLDQMVVQPCSIQGASTEDTVIQGVHDERPALWLEDTTCELQDLTILYEQEGALRNALQSSGSTLTARRCKIEGCSFGALFSRGSWTLLQDCEVIGRAKRGLQVDAVVYLQGGSVKGNDFAVTLKEFGELHASDCLIEGQQEGLRAEGGKAYLRNSEVTGVHDNALYMHKSAHVVTTGGRVRSVEATAIATNSDIDPKSPGRLVLRQTKVGPSKRALIVRAGASASLEECEILSPCSAFGGAVQAVDSTFHGLTRAVKGGYLGLLRCQLVTGDGLSLEAGQLGLIDARECSISTGTLAADGGALRLSDCVIRGSEELSAVDVARGHVALSACKVLQEASAPCIVVKNGTLTATNCELGTTHQSIAVVTPEGIAHFWDCRFEAQRADALLFQNQGRAHVFGCSFISNGWCVHSLEGSTIFVDRCKADCPKNPLSQVPGASVIEDRLDASEAVQQRSARELVVRPALFSAEVTQLLARLEEREAGAARQLVLASLTLTAPQLKFTVSDATAGELQLLASDDIGPEAVSYLARCASQLETTKAVLWTVARRGEGSFKASRFSFGQLHALDVEPDVQG